MGPERLLPSFQAAYEGEFPFCLGRVRGGARQTAQPLKRRMDTDSRAIVGPHLAGETAMRPNMGAFNRSFAG